MGRRPLLLVVLPVVLLAAGIAAVVAALPRLAEVVGPWWLARAHGLEEVSYQVEHLTLRQLVLREVRVGPGRGSVRVGRLDVSFDLRTGHIGAVHVADAEVHGQWRDGVFAVPGLPPDPLPPSPTDDPAPRTLLPWEHLRLTNARLFVQTPDGLLTAYLDGSAAQGASGPQVEVSASVQGLGLAAEASLSGTLLADAALPWAFQGSLHLIVMAEDAAVPGLGRGVTGAAHLRAWSHGPTAALTAGSDRNNGTVELVVAHPDPAVLARLPETLRDSARAGDGSMALRLSGKDNRPPLLALERGPDGGVTASLAAVGALRLGLMEADLDLHADMVTDPAGTPLSLTLPHAHVALRGVPVAGSTAEGDVTLTAARMDADGARATVDGHLRAGAVILPDASLPGVTLDLRGDVSHAAGVVTVALEDGALGLAPGATVAGVGLPQGGTWSLRPPADGGPALLADQDTGRVHLRLALPDAAAVLRLDDRAASVGAALADIDLLLDETGARHLALVVTDGRVTADDLEMHGIFATVREVPEDGLHLELDGRLPRLPGEATDLPAATAPHRPLRLRVDGTAPPDLSRFDFSAVLREARLRTLARIEGRHDLARKGGSATVSVPRLTLDPDALPAAALHAGFAEAGISLEGDVAASGAISWTPHGLETPGLDVLLDGVTLRRGFVTLQDLRGVMHLSGLTPPRTPPGQEVFIGRLDAGLPFTEAETRFHLDGRGNIVVEGASLSLAGGSIRSGPLVLPLDGSGAETALAVSGVRLRQLVALADLDGLDASGTVSGTLPVTLEDGNILFRNGLLEADAPGVLRYRPAQPPAALTAAGAGAALMLQALDDFHYRALRLTVDGSAAGDLTVGLHLAGANPALHGGYPLEFNLSLSGALAQVIEGAMTGYQVPEHVRRAMERFEVAPPPR